MSAEEWLKALGKGGALVELARRAERAGRLDEFRRGLEAVIPPDDEEAAIAELEAHLDRSRDPGRCPFVIYVRQVTCVHWLCSLCGYTADVSTGDGLRQAPRGELDPDTRLLDCQEGMARTPDWVCEVDGRRGVLVSTQTAAKVLSGGEKV